MMLKEFTPLRSINPGVLFISLRTTVFHNGFTQDQVDGINATLAAWDKLSPDADLRWVAYSCATKYWETDKTMQPVREIGRGRGRKYGNPAGPYGEVYYGRGDVQLTWWANYVKANRELHKRGFLKPEEDLERNPDLALRPDIAAAIMILGMTEGWFTSKKLADYFDHNSEDWKGARKIINGTDHDDDIARYARGFYTALKAAQVAAPKPAPTPAPAPEPAPQPAPEPVPAPVPAPEPAPEPVYITQETFDLVVAILKGHVKPVIVPSDPKAGP